MTRILEVALKDSASSWLADHARLQSVSEAEIVRRALQLYRDPAAWLEAHEDALRQGRCEPTSAEPRVPDRRALPSGEEVQDREPRAEVTVLAPSPAPCRRRLLAAPQPVAQVSLFPVPRNAEEGPAVDASPPSPVLVTPCIPSKKGSPREWGLSQTQLAAWEELFFDMDVVGVLKLAQGWLLSNHLKTFSGMKRFFFNWLVRAQNRGKYPKRAAIREASQRPTLKEVYGFESWEEWEAKLRRCLTPEELEVDLESLAELRRAWEARYGVG